MLERHLSVAFFLFLKLGDDMKISDHVSSAELQHVNNIKDKDKCLNNKSSEKLSNREIEELMGINRPTYKRVRGAIRRN